MSRRYTPAIPSLPVRSLTAALVATLTMGTFLPLATVAQTESISPQDIRAEWQLLTQQNAEGVMEDIPAGVGATMLLFSGAASGEGACSTYDSIYSSSNDLLFVSVDPTDPAQVQWRECDPTSREFDEAFYDNLARIESISRADSLLVVRDAVGDRLMVFTRAQIDNDPTASRWRLARIGGADGSVEPVIQGLDPWMEFLRGGSVVGSTGCGSFLGKYSTNEGRIDITDVAYRLGVCTDGARSQAETILATLDEVTDFQVRPAGLALEDETGTIRLALTPDLDVAGRTWTPTAVYDGSGKQIYGDGNELTTSAVRFIGGVAQGRSICRPFSANTVRSGLAVSIGQPEFIGAYCKGKVAAGQLGDIEAGFITALEDTSSYSLRGSELTLTDVDGITRAVLEPQPPLTGTTWVVSRMRKGKKLVTPSGDPITATFEEVDASRVGLVEGKTGVSRPQLGENEYFGLFETPTATVIDVYQLQVTGKGCRGRLGDTDPCKDEALFLQLLESASGYVVRDEDLKFYDETQPFNRQNTMVLQRERFEAGQ
jgi:heat shock protein HslJ